MFAVIYRGYVKAGREKEYQAHWHKIASYFISERGAIGSCLHQAEDGLWLAYSRWPDKKTRDLSWPSDDQYNDELPQEIILSINSIKDCLDDESKLPEICMEVVDDLMPE